MIVVQQAAEIRIALDFFRQGGLGRVFRIERNCILDALMRAVEVVVSFDLLHDGLKLSLANKDEVV